MSSVGINKDCYMGVFDCYHSPGRTERTLIMSGNFTVDDIYLVHIKLVEEEIIQILCLRLLRLDGLNM